MIPIVLDTKQVRLAVVGRGAATARRLGQLLDGNAGETVVFSDSPSDRLAELAGDRLVLGLPDAEWLRGFQAVWVVDLPVAEAERVARAARAVGTLVNVEDFRALCDFHTPAIVRRGDLLLTASTGGKSPGLAVRIRRHLEASFGPEWAGRLEHVARRRQGWRRRRRSLPEMARLTDREVDRQGWLE